MSDPPRVDAHGRFAAIGLPLSFGATSKQPQPFSRGGLFSCSLREPAGILKQ